MRIGLARVDDEVRSFLVEGDTALILPKGSPSPDDVVRSQAAARSAERLREDAERVALDTLDLLAPIQRFDRDVLCTGWNYWDHFEESKGRREGQDPRERPEHPTFFTKAPLSITGPVADIPWDPQLSEKWDYEVELAVVIGRAGRSIPEEHALEHVAGYLVANDISQRDMQRAHGGQWFKGKSVDLGSPIGPWLTTADEVDPSDLQLSLSLNGEVLQSSSTRHMAFSLTRIIAELSRGMTLLPGDLILTGTPAGIGNARTPQVFLKDGDEMVASVAGLGELRNTLRRSDLTSYWTPAQPE